MVGAIAADRLIHVYGGGGHTTLVMGEMFFRAGGLANINPIMETGLSVFNQALKYLELERCVNYGRSIVKYYRLQPDDVLIIFHNIGINPATIDAALEAKEAGVRSSPSVRRTGRAQMPPDHFIRHPNGKNLFDLADVCIDDYNEVGDCAVRVPGFDTPIAPNSNVVDFYHRPSPGDRDGEALRGAGIEPPVWRSANAPGGDEFNARYVDKYLPRVKSL